MTGVQTCALPISKVNEYIPIIKKSYFDGKDFGKPKEFKEKIQILNGRYGVYLKCGKTNLSLAKDTDIEKITIDDAVSLLEEKLKDKKGSILKKTKISNKKTIRKKKS